MDTHLLYSFLFGALVIIPGVIPLTLIGSIKLFFYLKNRLKFPKNKLERIIYQMDLPTSSKLELIKAVHHETKASIGLSKRALEEAGYDKQKAVDLLYATNSIKEGEILKEGRVFTYNHQNKVAVLLEINCKTDFAANTVEFGMFCNDVALQIAAMNPKTISRGHIPTNFDPLSSIPPPVPEKDESVLLEQESIVPDHTGKTLQQLLTALSNKLGEPIVIRRFNRYECGV